MSGPNPLAQKILPQGTQDLRSFVMQNYIGGLGTSQYEIDRVTKYHLYWKFYEGNHYRDYNDSMLAFNYVKAFIDKINIFLLGKDAFSWKVTSLYSDVIEKTVEQPAEQLIMYHWRKNNKAAKAYEMLQMGSVTGDCWVGVNWDFTLSFAKITIFDSRHCYPRFKDGDQNTLSSFLVRQPLMREGNLSGNPQGYMMVVTEYTLGTINQWYQKDAIIEKPVKYLEVTQPNPYGFIPIEHIKNKPFSAGYYSKSDAADILKLNKVYNELNQEIKAIIDYYTTPTTVITGASAKTLKRGIGNIWSGLPSDANVFNLGLDVDLGAANEFLRTIKTSMHELSDVPENALGKLQSIGNTSAAALAMTYQPLMQQADLKGITYGHGITNINTMILQMVVKFDPKNKRLKAMGGADFIDENVVEPVWAYGLPHDEMNDLQMENMKLNMEITSRRRVMEDLGMNNIPEILREIMEEKEQDADFEANFGGGNPPDANNPKGVNPADSTDVTKSGKVPAPKTKGGKLGTP